METIRINMNQRGQMLTFVGNMYKLQIIGKGIKETNQDESKDSLDASQYLRSKGTICVGSIVGVVESSVICKRRRTVNILSKPTEHQVQRGKSTKIKK